MSEIDPKSGALQAILKGYVLPIIFWAVAAVGTVTFVSKDVTDRLDRIETNIERVVDEQEKVREDLEDMKKRTP